MAKKIDWNAERMKERMITHGTIRLNCDRPEAIDDTPARPEEIIVGVVERAEEAFQRDIIELERLRADYDGKIGKEEYSWIDFDRLERRIKNIERRLPAKYRDPK